jgi:2-polyprenyl-3-methyl-5-hydroxy-6-metoxy-1,4-benzoquinol methylase
MGNKKEKIITGNYFDKYSSKNILVKYAMRKYFNTFEELLKEIKAKKILEVGCGEGEIINYLKKKFPKAEYNGFEIENKLIKKLSKRFPKDKFERVFLDSSKFNLIKRYDLVLCLEVLEHIKAYDKSLENLASIKAKHIIISVPNEPFFRIANVLRFKYLKNLGNTPGHMNNFNYLKFKKIIKNKFPDKVIKFKNALIWNFAYIKNE